MSPTSRSAGAVTSAPLGTLFDVQRFSIHDGPGIRTTVFFKGCSLDCDWCQNPESKSGRPELSYLASRCIDCERCASACHRGALAPRRDGRVDWSRCAHCGDCVSACPSGALTMIGRRVTASALLDEVLADRAFYASSGGGVTLSGGEPVLQWQFLSAFLPLARQAGLQVLLQTAGNYAWRCVAPLLPQLDQIYFDVKLPDAAAYRRYTGRYAERPFDNLHRLIAAGVTPTVRMPVVPGVNSTPTMLAEIAQRLTRMGVGELTLLPYHDLWTGKLDRLAPRSERRLPLNEPIAWDDVLDTLSRSGLTVTRAAA